MKALEADVYEKLGQTASATKALAEGIDALESQGDNVTGGALGRIQHFNKINSHYKRLIKLLVDQGETERAVTYAERAKARALLDLNPHAPRPVWNKHKDFFPGGILHIMKRSPYGSARQIKNVSADVQPRPDVISHEAMRSLLPDRHTAILEYVLGDEKSYLFVLTAENETSGESRQNKADESWRTRLRWRKYDIETNKFSLFGEIYRLNEIIFNNRIGYADLSQSLHHKLLAPAGEALKGKSSLIIIPDGVLWSLPFQALQPSPERFLLEDFDIAYTPSLAVLAGMRKLHDTSGEPLPSWGSPDVLALGNPTFTLTEIRLRNPPQYSLLRSPGDPAESDADSGAAGQQSQLFLMKPLPGAADEANSLREIYGPRSVLPLIGPMASKDAFLRVAGKYRIIHLATHGVLNDHSALDSAIVLGRGRVRVAENPDHDVKTRVAVENNGPDEDLVLTAREVMGMRLRAELVVLSACDTAGGGVSDGEGMVGLTWAFAAAGVPAVVASQWAVNDRTTAGLMADFHRRLKASSAGGRVRGTAAALRGAALALAGRKEYRHPYYWAAFIAVGDAR